MAAPRECERLRFFRKLGLRLARIGPVRWAIVERADLGPFRARPSARLLIGVGLIGLSMLLGWPLIGALGTLAIYLGEPLVAVIGGPAAYGLSWVVYGSGLLVAGREALYYAGVFNRWLLRVVVERLAGAAAVEQLRAEAQPAVEDTAGDAGAATPPGAAEPDPDPLSETDRRSG